MCSFRNSPSCSSKVSLYSSLGGVKKKKKGITIQDIWGKYHINTKKERGKSAFLSLNNTHWLIITSVIFYPFICFIILEDKLVVSWVLIYCWLSELLPLMHQELANSVSIQTRGHLVRFMDAIEEILVQQMHTELHPDGISAWSFQFTSALM